MSTNFMQIWREHCTQIRCGRAARFDVEGVEVSGFSREKLLFTGIEITTGWMREVEEKIVLDEGTRRVGEEAM